MTITEAVYNLTVGDYQTRREAVRVIRKYFKSGDPLDSIRAKIEFIIDNTYDNTDCDKSLYNIVYRDGLYKALDIIVKCQEGIGEIE